MNNKEKQTILDVIEARTWNILEWAANARPEEVEVNEIKDCLTCLEIISILKEELPCGDDTK